MIGKKIGLLLNNYFLVVFLIALADNISDLIAKRLAVLRDLVDFTFLVSDPRRFAIVIRSNLFNMFTNTYGTVFSFF